MGVLIAVYYALFLQVLHPGVYRMFERDLSILRAIAAAGERLFSGLRWLSLSECVEEFAVLMTRQVINHNIVKLKLHGISMPRTRFHKLIKSQSYINLTSV